MNLIEKIESTISHDKEIIRQLDSLSQFDDLSEKEILELTKYSKSSEVGILIEYLGYKKLKKHLPAFLIFLQDGNWPAARGASNMLVKSGVVIIPELKKVFKNTDEIWHYWILTLIVSQWDKELVEILKPELMEAVMKGDKEGACIQALSLLKSNELISKNNIYIHYQYLLKKFEGSQDCIDDLKAEIYPGGN